MTGDALPVLSPAGVEAAAITEVAWVLIAGAAALFALTAGVLAWSLRRRDRPPATAWWVVGGGIVLPVTVLTALLVYATARTEGLDRPPAQGPALVVGVTGAMWWWQVRYRDPASGREVVSANELRLPAGRPVQLGLASADVLHSFWIPALGGKRDLVPGRVNRLVVTATVPGVHRGTCAEYCGAQHARMALHAVVMPADDFDRWLAAQAQPAAEPGGDARLVRGRALFLDHGCAACHAVRGTADGGGRGPDLTHVAGRLHLGAGTLPNDGAAAMARWLTGVQDLKPGAHMPSITHLPPDALDALAAYLAHLR